MNTTLALGLLLVVGLLGGSLAVRGGMPSVTGYILLGLVIGPSFLGLITHEVIADLDFLRNMALAIVAMTIGGELRGTFFRRLGRELLPPFLGETILTFGLVAGGTILITGSLPMALILGVLATATAPAAIMSIIREENADSPFSRSLMALVALDSLFCIVAFGIVVGLGGLWVEGVGVSLMAPLIEVLASLLLGLSLGGVLGLASMQPISDEKLLVLVLGLLLAVVGLGSSFGLSPLLIAMTAGIVIGNMPIRAWRPFWGLRTVEMPVLVAFLTLAGTYLDVSQITEIGALAVVYIILRAIGKVVGGAGGVVLSTLPKRYRWNLGVALTPQAGVAVGLAVFAEAELPFAAGITTLVLSAVIVLEILTPPLVRKALKMELPAEEESVGSRAG